MKDQESFKKELAEKTGKIATIESNFLQEKNLSVISEKIITKGKFCFKKEKKLRWEYTEPFQYLIIINGDKIFIKDENKESNINVQSNRLFDEINNIIIGSVRGTILNDDKSFNIILMENNTYDLVKLFPKTPQMKEFLQEIRIYFDKNDLTVSILEMQEASGDYTKIEFTDKKFNAPIPDETFSAN
jgi:outer membrane lipoprotein-sorting protein